MTITNTLYNKLLSIPNIDPNLKKELTDRAHCEQWVFVGS